MRYCPNCSMTLITKMDGGRDRLACPDESCGFIHFGTYSIGCAAVVIRDSKALLVQRGWNPGRGSWQIPGGYVEADEAILEAVERDGHAVAALVLSRRPEEERGGPAARRAIEPPRA